MMTDQHTLQWHIVNIFISKKIVHDFSAKPNPQTMSLEEGIFTRVSLGVWKFQCQVIIMFNPTAYAARRTSGVY